MTQVDLLDDEPIRICCLGSSGRAVVMVAGGPLSRLVKLLRVTISVSGRIEGQGFQCLVVDCDTTKEWSALPALVVAALS
jgi:hypothetical protein